MNIERDDMNMEQVLNILAVMANKLTMGRFGYVIAVVPLSGTSEFVMLRSNMRTDVFYSIMKELANTNEYERH